MQTVGNSWLREIHAGVSPFIPGARVHSADGAQGQWTAPASAERDKMAKSLDTTEFLLILLSLTKHPLNYLSRKNTGTW